MAKFMILFNSSDSAIELMEHSSSGQVQASMQDWIKWKEGLPDSVGHEWGMPLQARDEVSNNGVQPSRTHVSGYATMEGEREAIVEALKTHPSLKRKDSSIEVLEMISMPGM